MPEQYTDLRFPLRGVDESPAYTEQIVGSTPLGVNVRGFEIFTERMRGGSRAGISPYMQTQLPGEIQDLNLVIYPSEIALGISFDDVEILDVNFHLEDPTGFTLADGTLNWIYIGGSGYSTPESYRRQYNPVITLVNPGSGEFEGGETITITGSRMGGLNSTFHFGDATAHVLTNDGTTATMIAPSHPESEEPVEVDVVVQTNAGISPITDATVYTYGGGIEFVQSASVALETGDDQELAFDADVAEGNLLVLCVAEPVGLLNTVSDTLGNSWTKITSTIRGAFTGLNIWYTISNQAGANTVTWTYLGPQPKPRGGVAVLEYSGAKSTGTVDSSDINISNTGNTWMGDECAVSQSGTLVLACMTDGQFSTSDVFDMEEAEGWTMREELSLSLDTQLLFVMDILDVDEGQTASGEMDDPPSGQWEPAVITVSFKPGA